MELARSFEQHSRAVKYGKYGPLPPVTWNIDAKTETKYTPDIGKLEQKLTWLMFCYDEFSEGEDVNIYTFTQHRYQMWTKDLGQYQQYIPLPVSNMHKNIFSCPEWSDPNLMNPSLPIAARVRGRLYLVSPQTIISLDKDMQNTVRFDRVRTPLLYPYRTMVKYKNHGPTESKVVGSLWAWMYVARHDYWEPLIEPDNNGLFKRARLQRPESLWVGEFYTNERE